MDTNERLSPLAEVASRIKEMRDIMGYSMSDMAEKTGISLEEYMAYENAQKDMPFSFIHKCALAFGIEMTELLEGATATLSSYTVVRNHQGQQTTKTDGISIINLAPKFKNKLGEPYYVRYEYDEKLQKQPIKLHQHSGQEFDVVIMGQLKVQVGAHQEILNPGDSIFYNSSTPHGEIAVGGSECIFYAFVMDGENNDEEQIRQTIALNRSNNKLLSEEFADFKEDEFGSLVDVKFKNTDRFNFGYDVVDAIAKKYPNKLAMIHLDVNKKERRFTFNDIKKESGRAANYFKSIGIKKGDKVMLVLKRHWQFWICMVALHKLGAIAVPATYMLKQHDFEYRFNAANVSTLICTVDGNVSDIAEEAMKNCPQVVNKIVVNGKKEGWRCFDEEYPIYTSSFRRTNDTPSGDEPALMFFSSGTTGNPKMVLHAHTYGLGHFVTAKYWHCCQQDGLHFTISDTGWGKSLWGKLYGQWMCEGAVFVYDFDRFAASDIMPLFAQYKITTFCAPPTMLRMMIKEDLSKYDFSSVKHMTTAGEALNPEVAKQFEKLTGLEIMEGFGQTETTLAIANLGGTKVKLSSMGKPSPQYDIDLVDPDGNSVAPGETGEIVIRLGEKQPVGLFLEYLDEPEKNVECRRYNMYHTGDTAYKDEDGYYFYVGRVDDIIKSSGYRIGPFEIESVIMELPYVLECGVSAVPDEVRGQVVKASIVLTKGTEPTEALKKEIQEYVKAHTAPYKYPRVVVFKDSLPKTISGKIQRNKL